MLLVTPGLKRRERMYGSFTKCRASAEPDESQRTERIWLEVLRSVCGTTGVPYSATVIIPGRILIIEDDDRIGAALTRAIDGSGYVTTWSSTGKAGEAAFRAVHQTDDAFDLVLLDLGLPDIDGLEVCRRLTTLDQLVPIVMLTARDDELDLVVGLDAGAVDYVTKPFTLAALLARIRAHLRRTNTVAVNELGNVPNVSSAVEELSRSSSIQLDLRARKIYMAGVEVVLRAKEFDLLARLMQDTGAVLTREILISDVWDENWFGSTKTLDFHIAALRRKLDVSGQPTRIATVRGVGFRFEG